MGRLGSLVVVLVVGGVVVGARCMDGMVLS